MRKMLAAAAAILGALLATAGTAQAAACDRSWDGGGDGRTWSDAGNWVDDVVPTPGQHVCIPDMPGAPYVRVDTPVSVGSIVGAESVHVDSSLTLTDAATTSTLTSLALNGTLDGDGNVDVSGTFAWIGGSMWGGGRTRVTATGTATLDGGGNLGRTLRLEGTASWRSGQFTLFDPARLENAGTLDLVATSASLTRGSGAPALVNTGTLTRTAGVFTTTSVDLPLQNTGTIAVDAGELSFSAGSTDAASTGAFGTAAQNGTLVFAAGTFRLGSAATIAGHARIQGTVQIVGTVTTTGSLELIGTIAGPGELRVAGELDWVAGGMGDAGTTRVLPSGRLEITTSPRAGSGTVYIGQDRQLDLEGTTRWAAQSIQVADRAVIRNSGTFDALEDQSIYRGESGADSPQLINTGLITRSTGSASSSHVAIPVENDGAIESQAGLLSVDGAPDAVSTGRYGTSGMGGQLQLTGAPSRLGSGASFAGEVDLLSPLRVDGLTRVAGTLNQHADILGGGDLEVAGLLRWYDGATSGTGRTRILAGGKLSIESGAGYYRDQARTIRNEGRATWRGGQLRMMDGAVFENAGVFDVIAPAGTLYRGGSGADVPQIVNTGTLTRSAGLDSVTTLTVPVVNDGVVESPAGQLTLDGGGTSTGRYGSAGDAGTVLLNGATIRAADGTRLDGNVEIGTSFSASGVVRSDGALRLTGSIDGPGRFDVAGQLAILGGDMGAKGVTRALAGSTTTFDRTSQYCCDGDARIDRTLRLEGATTWIDGSISLDDGAVIENAGSFDAIAPDQSMNRAGSGALIPEFTNLGTLTRSRGIDSITHIGIPVVNDGVVSLAAGMLDVTGRYVQSADGRLSVVAQGTVAREDYGLLSVRNNARLLGQVDLDAHYAAQVGDVLSALDYTSRRGAFDTTTGTLPPGRHAEVSYQLGGAKLTVVADPAVAGASKPSSTAPIASTAMAPLVPGTSSRPLAAPTTAASGPERVRTIDIPARTAVYLKTSRLVGSRAVGARVRIRGKVRGVSLDRGGRRIRIRGLAPGRRVRIRVRVIGRGGESFTIVVRAARGPKTV